MDKFNVGSLSGYRHEYEGDYVTIYQRKPVVICAAHDEMLLRKVGVCHFNTFLSAPTCRIWNTQFVRDN